MAVVLSGLNLEITPLRATPGPSLQWHHGRRFNCTKFDTQLPLRVHRMTWHYEAEHSRKKARAKSR